MRPSLNLVCLISVVLLVDRLSAQPAPTPTLTVRGTAVAGDEKAATKAAIEKALSGVVEIILDAPARKKHAVTITDKILPKSAEMVKSHEVLKSEKIAGGKVSVEVRVVVDRATVIAKLTEVGVITKEDNAAAETAQKIVAFCKDNLGKMVGDGECGTLAVKAAEAAGAKPFFEYKENPGVQDFVWGELVFVQEFKDGKRIREPADAKAKPGDVIQYRDATFRSSRGIYIFSHHTAVIAEVKATGELIVYEQNMQGKKEVTKGSLRPSELAGGWIRVYRPVKK